MVLVMKNNIFEWGDCYFLQLLRTAMGTSAACMWAIIYFAIHKIDKLLPNYGGYILIFKRFIDDMFGIWVCGNNATWNRFKNKTNDFGVLRWEFDNPSMYCFPPSQHPNRAQRHPDKHLPKTDQPISIHTTLFGSPTRYDEGHHFSLMKNYKRQNSKQCDYEDMAIKLFHRHVARGRARSTMNQYIVDAHRKLSSHQASPAPTSLPAPLSNKERLFSHLQFHPNDIPRKVI
ncbi:hypothetical protein ACHAWF_000452 [Thalassiosira exigua]